MTNLWHDIDRNKIDELNVIIEIPKGTRTKYEVDHKTGIIKFDRVVQTAMTYSTNYGFVPQTLWEDEDALDVLVISEEPLISGCLVVCRPVGVLHMNDSGESDAKVIAVPIKDPRFDNVQDISDVNEHLKKEISHFFSHYKDLKNKVVEVGEWEDKNAAIEAAQKSFDMYDAEYKK